MVDKKNLKSRVFKYRNEHPKHENKRVIRAFRDDNKVSVKRLYYMWKSEIETLKWLYEYMVKKWAPKLALTKKDKIVLRRIERMIGI